MRSGIVAEAGEGFATVVCERGEACGSCAACGAGTTSAHRVRAVDPFGCAVGDRVELGADVRAVLAACALLFLLPAAVIVAVLAAWGVAAAFACGIVYFVSLRLFFLRSLERAAAVRVLRRIDPCGD